MPSENSLLTDIHTAAIDRINDLLITMQDDTADLYRENITRLAAALVGITERYTSLVNSGDAGNWDPEADDVVIAARTAIALAKV